MGQYHRIYNLDKKETLGAIASGIKLLEMSSDYYTMTALMVLMCNSNGRGGGDLNVEVNYDKDYNRAPTPEQTSALFAVESIQGRWAGDRIVVQGDYATEGDKALIAKEDLETFTDITRDCVNALRVTTDLKNDLGFLINESLKGRAERKFRVSWTLKNGKTKEKLFKTIEDPEVGAFIYDLEVKYGKKNVKQDYVFVAKEVV